MLAVAAVFFAAVVVLTLTLAHTHEKRSLIVGLLCVVFGTCMYAAPLAAIIPNGLGAFLGALQLILYGMYYKTTVWGDDEEVDKVEGPA